MQVPEIKDVALKHGIKIGGFQVHSSGRRVVIVAALDNLLKGAATQCLQVSMPTLELKSIPESFACSRSFTATEPQHHPRLRRARGHPD